MEEVDLQAGEANRERLSFITCHLVLSANFMCPSIIAPKTLRYPSYLVYIQE